MFCIRFENSQVLVVSGKKYTFKKINEYRGLSQKQARRVVFLNDRYLLGFLTITISINRKGYFQGV